MTPRPTASCKGCGGTRALEWPWCPTRTVSIGGPALDSAATHSITRDGETAAISSPYARMARLAARHPSLWLPLLRSSWTFRARDWYRRPPFLPLPPASYLQWRMETAYGDADATPPVSELNRYLRWTAEMRRRR